MIRYPLFSPPFTLPRAWLALGVFALIAAGLLALLLVLARTPVLGSWLPWTDFFHTALVVHVDLSVLVWFLSVSALLWQAGRRAPSLLAHTALVLDWTGTVLLAASPFLGSGPPLQNNYVPVLLRPVFHAGLGLFALGILLQTLIGIRRAPSIDPFLAATTRLSAFAVLLTALLFLRSFHVLAEESLPPEVRYEHLFWSSGHVIQFSHVLILLACWHLLLGRDSPAVTHPRIACGLAVIAFLPVLGAPAIEWNLPLLSVDYRLAYTRLMQYGGLFMVPAGAWLALRYLRRPGRFTEATRASMGMSILLFLAGGVLGFLIEGANVVIPAHYHGSIVGITLALMGIAYGLLPGLGHRLTLPRLARWQPVIYGGGQLLHITGLAWSGGYGVQRKVAGSAQGLDTLEKMLGMGLMGLGGLISIVGGLLFVVVMVASLLSQRREEAGARS